MTEGYDTRTPDLGRYEKSTQVMMTYRRSGNHVIVPSYKQVQKQAKAIFSSTSRVRHRPVPAARPSFPQ
jgi:hypothetical protein